MPIDAAKIKWDEPIALDQIQWDDESPKFGFGRLASQTGRATAQGVADLARGARSLESMVSEPKEPVQLNPAGGLAQMRERAMQAASKDPYTTLRNQAVSELKPIEQYAPEMLPGTPEGFGGMVEQAASGMARFAPSMVTSAVNPVAGTASTFTQIFGMERDKYQKQGVDNDRANTAALISAIGQTPLEMAGNLLQIGALKNMAKGVTGPLTSRLARFGEALLKGAVGEGGEEYLQAYPEAIADIYAANPNKSPNKVAKLVLDKISSGEFQKEAGYSAAIGALGGIGLAGAGGVISEAARPAIKADTQTAPQLAKEQIVAGIQAGVMGQEDLNRIATERPELAAVINEAIQETSQPTQAQVNQSAIDATESDEEAAQAALEADRVQRARESSQEAIDAAQIDENQVIWDQPDRIQRNQIRNQELIDAAGDTEQFNDLEEFVRNEKARRNQLQQEQELNIQAEAEQADKTVTKRRFAALSQIWDTLSPQEQDNAISLIVPQQESLQVKAERQAKAEGRDSKRTTPEQRQVEAERKLKEADRLGLQLEPEYRKQLESEIAQSSNVTNEDELKRTGQWVEPVPQVEPESSPAPPTPINALPKSGRRKMAAGPGIEGEVDTRSAMERELQGERRSNGERRSAERENIGTIEKGKIVKFPRKLSEEEQYILEKTIAHEDEMFLDKYPTWGMSDSEINNLTADMIRESIRQYNESKKAYDAGNPESGFESFINPGDLTDEYYKNDLQVKKEQLLKSQKGAEIIKKQHEKTKEMFLRNGKWNTSDEKIRGRTASTQVETKPQTKRDKALQEYRDYVEGLNDEQRQAAGDLIEDEPKSPSMQIIRIKRALASKFEVEKPIQQSRQEPQKPKESKTKLKVEKLRGTAKRVKERAEEKYNQDRNTNTARRARMAAGAQASAAQEIQIADTMVKIADGIESGEISELSGVTAKSHVENLDRISTQAHYEYLRKKYDSYSDQQQHFGEPIPEDAIEFARYPESPELSPSDRGSIKRFMAGKRGIGEIKALMDQPITYDRAKKILSLAKKHGFLKEINWTFEDRIKRITQLRNMGINDIESLRKVLKEYLDLRAGRKKEDPIKALERQLIGQKVGVDFFPTPKSLAERMVNEADIQEGIDILEPSAGKGDIADVITSETGQKPDTAEISGTLRDLLETKGYDLVGNDFLEISGKKYDRIIMNPPFSKNQDVRHVMHAYDLLKPGGRIVAIMGEHSFFANDKESVAFREWLDEHGVSEKLPAGTFKGKEAFNQTGVNSRFVVIDKPKDSKKQGPIDILKNQKGSSEILNDVVNLFARPQTKTPQFKKWFSGSKVVDENGEPLVVYHGTREDFDVFVPQKGSDLGFHFGTKGQSNIRLDETRGKLHVSGMGQTTDLGENILPVYLSLNNPLRVNDPGYFSAADESFANDLRGNGIPVESSDSNKQLIEKIKSKGYDGLVYTNYNEMSPYDLQENLDPDEAAPPDSYIVFDPTQIKSALSNTEAFDPNNPSIRGESQLIGDISRYGADLILKGVDTLHKFRRAMRTRFADVWDKIKGHMRDLWDILKNQRGAIKIEKKGKVESVDDLIAKLQKASPINQKEAPQKSSEEAERSDLTDYENVKDVWFGDKDQRILENKVEVSNLQDEIKSALGLKRYGAKGRNIDKAVQIYIDLKRNPDHLKKYYDQLTPEQKRTVDLSQSLPDNIKKIADKISESYTKMGMEALDQGLIRNVLDNYAARVWDIQGKPGSQERRKFGTTTRHAKQRKFGTILEGWANGYTLKVNGATNNLNVLKDEIVKTIQDKKFLNTMMGLVDSEGNPLVTTKQLDGYEEIKHPNFIKWEPVGKAQENKTGEIKWYGKNSFADENGQVWERKPIYAQKDIAKNLNNILGTSSINNIPGVHLVTKYNAITKSWILQSSFFHHLAFMRSYYLGTNHKTWKEMNIRKAYKEGVESIKQLDPIVRLAVKNGLTLGVAQDWSENLLREKTAIGKILDKNKVSRAVKDKILLLREMQSDFLFSKFGAGLKAKAFAIEYRNQLKKYPNQNPDVIAKRVANLINDDFGGLHLGRIGRNPTTQHIFRIFALAPDWTESNIRTMVKAVKAGSKEETAFYRKFWAGILVKGIGATVLANFMLAGGDPEDFKRKYKKAWKAGNFRWLDIDITPIYRALGGETKEHKYFSILGHFKDPTKFITHPVRSAHHKGSVVYRTMHEALTGVNWAGQKYTTLEDLVDKKRLTKYGSASPLGYSQIPSYAISQIIGAQPVQVQNAIRWSTGDMEGFDAIANSLGLGTSTTYSPKNKVDFSSLKSSNMDELEKLGIDFNLPRKKYRFGNDESEVPDDVYKKLSDEFSERLSTQFNNIISGDNWEDLTTEQKIKLLKRRRTRIGKRYNSRLKREAFKLLNRKD